MTWHPFYHSDHISCQTCLKAIYEGKEHCHSEVRSFKLKPVSGKLYNMYKSELSCLVRVKNISCVGSQSSFLTFEAAVDKSISPQSLFGSCSGSFDHIT